MRRLMICILLAATTDGVRAGGLTQPAGTPASGTVVGSAAASGHDSEMAMTDVFVSGQHDYHSFRIPAIVTTRKGTLLAFCEGRRDSRSDAGNIDLVVCRSTDGGASWSDPQLVWDDADNTCGNPAPVVDQSTGTIWLPMTWNLGSDHEKKIKDGTSRFPREVYLTHSTDDGRTWAPPTKISQTTRQPHWRWYATGPGNAIQLTRGTHAGRLLIPANHSDHTDDSQHPFRSHVFWSDDHGASWTLGAVQADRTNESAVVELPQDGLLHVMRSYHGGNRRAMAISEDSGATFGEVYLDEALDTPVCQASAIRYSWGDDGRSRILFSSPRGKSRSDLHVWLSYDEGRTWPVCRRIYEGGSAYSNLIKLPHDRVGVLFEKDGYKTITLATFPLSWLESPE